MLSRNVISRIFEALADTPVVFLAGARQTGKSTLVRELVRLGHFPGRYLTLDDASVLDAIRSDPQGFVERLDGPVILDEVQRAPEIFLAIKLSVDRNRSPGRFLLTGSANILLVPHLSESLAGRMQILTLRPFSVGEQLGLKEGFIDWAFSSAPLPNVEPAGSLETIDQYMFTGGFPEAVIRTGSRRQAWFRAYTRTLIQRDVRELSNIEELDRLPRVLKLIATRAGGLLNTADLATALTIPAPSLRRYLRLYEAVYLLYLLPPWSANIGKRLVKSPKMYLTDSGIAAHLTGATAERLLLDPQQTGVLFETFVLNELLKQWEWSETMPELFHFRTYSGAEIDILMEDAAGRIVAIEIKSRVSAKKSDATAMYRLRDELGDRFHRGLVLSRGSRSYVLDSNIYAIPTDALWSYGAASSSSL